MPSKRRVRGRTVGRNTTRDFFSMTGGKEERDVAIPVLHRLSVPSRTKKPNRIFKQWRRGD